MTTDAHDTTTTPAEAGPDSTGAWMAAERAHLERLMADAEAVRATPKRWWRPAPLPWLVVRQYQRKEHVICAHRFEWVAELCSTRRERVHRYEVGVHYTARHRTHIRKAGGGEGRG